MNDHACPPGWNTNPSAWPERLAVLSLAATGLGISLYLGLYQVHAIGSVWEPVFGEGSRNILRDSALARLLPIPDAFLGAGLYLLDLLFGLFGGHERWRTQPWAVLIQGVIAVGLALAGVLLTILQPVAFGSFCTLCLCSGACSVLMVGWVLSEVLAVLQHLHRVRLLGGSVRHGLGRGDVDGLVAPWRPAGAGGGRLMWPRLHNVLIGLWLMASPAIFHYGHSASVNNRVLGPVVLACALIGLHEVARGLRWVNLVIGGWLLVAPWLLADTWTATLNQSCTGILLIVASLLPGRTWMEFGGGWSALWRDTDPARAAAR